MGSRAFAAQYQQNPTPAEGNIIKATWLGRYPGTACDGFDQIVLSCDPAGKSGPRNDYTAITVLGIRQKTVHVLHATRGHWTVMQMREQIIALSASWGVHCVIIEDTATGMGLIQLLREQTSLSIIGRKPDAKKDVRMARHQGRFEAGRILLPNDAPWLADFERELLAFPSGRYDDQVDALLLFLDWLVENEVYLQPFDYFINIGFLRKDPDRWNDWHF
jgi:predicted phage terminase large subunit-like protein